MAAAGITLSLRAPELREIEARLGKVVRAIARPVALMRIVAAALESSTRQRFRTNLAPDGTPWKPSVRATQAGGRTLFQHGRLRDSITSDADEDRAIVGSNLVYAAIHQTGGVIRARTGGLLTFQIPGVGWRRVAQVTLPARPYLGVAERDRVELADQVERYIERSAA